MIQIQGLSKNYRKIEAISDLSFAVQAGEVLGLLGPNGAGKTTSLRSIAGVIRPDQGSIRVGDHDVATNPVEAKRILGYLTDQPAFFDNLTCWEHIRFVASVHSISDHEPKVTSRKFCYHLQCSESARKLYRDGSWWPAPKARVRSLRIVMISPSIDNDFSFK
jgi:ABC-type multidrug transport system ATPase subunit